MVVSGDYPRPIQVNGFTCKNCTDVDRAKLHIDPQHPQSGPYDVNAANDPTRTKQNLLEEFGGNDSRMSVRSADINGCGDRVDVIA